MNKAELREACERIAVDFRLELRTSARGKLWAATCVYRGQLLELTMEHSNLFDAERRVLELCFADLRRRETSKAA